MASGNRVPVTIQESGKAKTLYIQIAETANIPSLLVYEGDGAKKPRNQVVLTQAIAELYQQDFTSKTICLIGTKDLLQMAFATPAEASTWMGLINSKSDLFKDSQSMSQLEKNIESIWPFPSHQ
jgi:hypothetical protein